jgi:hypothetical protein
MHRSCAPSWPPTSATACHSPPPLHVSRRLSRFGIKAPDTKNDLSAPFPFNLMFKVGPPARCAAPRSAALCAPVCHAGGSSALQGHGDAVAGLWAAPPCLRWQPAGFLRHLPNLSRPLPCHSVPAQTSIGPKGDMVGYLRPETAQVGFDPRPRRTVFFAFARIFGTAHHFVTCAPLTRANKRLTYDRL